ncbi:hypothetical protein ACROYT_G022717 [Oculina patagonica]
MEENNAPFAEQHSFLHFTLLPSFKNLLRLLNSDQPFKGKQRHDNDSAAKRGFACGNLYNTHKAWERSPEWMKASYRLEMEYLGGDIDTPLKGALKGMIEGGVEYYKHNPTDAMQMGRDIAKVANITPDKGIAFAQGFMSTAKFE